MDNFYDLKIKLTYSPSNIKESISSLVGGVVIIMGPRFGTILFGNVELNQKDFETKNLLNLAHLN